MSLYKDVYQELEDYPKFYRFEGGKSFNCFDINKSDLIKSGINNGYVFFSLSLKHHVYYVQRRVKQFIYSYLNEYGFDSEIDLLQDDYIYSLIRDKILFSEKPGLYSLTFITSTVMSELLKDNALRDRDKVSEDKRVIRCDRTRYGGGYGICDEWLDLFKYQTFAYLYQSISKEDVLDYIGFIRSGMAMYMDRNQIFSFLFDIERKNIRINEAVLSDFSKYNLLNSIEEILEKNLYCEKSILDNVTKDIIRNLLQRFQTERQDILRILDKNYNNKLT